MKKLFMLLLAENINLQSQRMSVLLVCPGKLKFLMLRMGVK